MRRAADRALEQMGDAFLKHLIGRQPDRVLVALGLQELVDLGVREGGIGAKVAAHVSLPISRDHRLQNIMPAIGGMDVAGRKRAAFQIAELVEHEQRMIAGAAEVAVVGGAFLLAIGRADAGIHVQHDALRRTAAVNTVDPSPARDR